MLKSEVTPSAAQKNTNRVQRSVNLLLVSFLALYLELVLIRWLASEIRVFAYFKNFPSIVIYILTWYTSMRYYGTRKLSSVP